MKHTSSDISLSVKASEEGMTLLSFLRLHYPLAPSIKAIKRAIDCKHCKVNGGVEHFASHPLKKGDLVSINPDTFFLQKILPLKNLSVLYEDPFLRICNKPAGMLSASQNDWILVHRLDKETSGALIFAKDLQIKEKMIVIFQQQLVKKVYLALVDGIVKQDAGQIDNYLGKIGGYQGQTIYGVVSCQKGKRAITLWKCLKKGKRATLLLLEPITGRTHQLRVHLNEMGHPILGDLQYGQHFRSSIHPQRHLLHAYQISFPHPITGKEMKVVAPIPLDFKHSMESVGIQL